MTEDSGREKAKALIEKTRRDLEAKRIKKKYFKWKRQKWGLIEIDEGVYISHRNEKLKEMIDALDKLPQKGDVTRYIDRRYKRRAMGERIPL